MHVPEEPDMAAIEDAFPRVVVANERCMQSWLTFAKFGFEAIFTSLYGRLQFMPTWQLVASLEDTFAGCGSKL